MTVLRMRGLFPDQEYQPGRGTDLITFNPECQKQGARDRGSERVEIWVIGML